MQPPGAAARPSACGDTGAAAPLPAGHRV